MARYKIDCCTQDCPKRNGDCHSTCPEYKKQRAELDETNSEKRKKADVQRSLNYFQIDCIHKNTKRSNCSSKRRKGY